MTETFSDWIIVIPGFVFSTIGFVVYYFLNTREESENVPEIYNNTRKILFQRLSGILIFGILPVFSFMILTHETNLSFVFGNYNSKIWLWILPISLVIIIIAHFSSRTKENLRMYPQIRLENWNRQLLFLSAVSWTGYLLSYEILFRGLLFTPMVGLTGLWPAIIINTGIYSLAHLPKGKREAFGAIPFGIIICLLVYKTGTLWIAIIIHVVMALSNEWYSIKYHPDINIRKV